MGGLAGGRQPFGVTGGLGATGTVWSAKVTCAVGLLKVC